MINALASVAHLQLFVFSSQPFPHQKKKRDFTLAETHVACHSAPVSPGAITKLLLSTVCLCGRQFMRVMNLSSLLANIFQFVVPVYSSAKYIVLQIGKREPSAS